MSRNLGHGEIVLHQKEDGSVQLRDSLSFLWCACGKPAVEREKKEINSIYEFQCIKCNKEYNS